MASCKICGQAVTSGVVVHPECLSGYKAYDGADGIVKMLRRLAVERRPETCLGCGYEHGCSVHGCAVIKRAAEMLQGIKSGQCIWTPLRRGETVYFVLEDDGCPDGWTVSEPHMVTEVGTRGFWTSGLPVESPDGMHDFTPWEELGKSAFLDKEKARLSVNMQVFGTGKDHGVGESWYEKRFCKVM